MRITSDDLEGNIPEQEPGYKQEPQQSSTTESIAGGGGLGQYSGMLREVKEILQHLKDLGVVNQQQAGQMQQAPQQPQQAQSMQQSGQQTQGNQAGNRQENIDQAVNQAYKQLNQFTKLAEAEKGKDATVEEIQQWMVEEERSLKNLIREQIEAAT